MKLKGPTKKTKTYKQTKKQTNNVSIIGVPGGGEKKG